MFSFNYFYIFIFILYVNEYFAYMYTSLNYGTLTQKNITQQQKEIKCLE